MEIQLPTPNPDTRVSNEIIEILDLPSDPTEVATGGIFANIKFAPNHGDEYRTENVTIAAMAQELQSSGERINAFYLERLKDRRFLEGLTVAAEWHGTKVIEYMKHSSRYSIIDRWGGEHGGVHDIKNEVTVPQSPDNLHANGNLRRVEKHDRFNMDYVISKGIDPNYVLYFRATRPSVTPKPEYYWTSDFREVNYGLQQEGSNRQADSIVLVSTLSQIAENGGLMIDVNDDEGIAVRQIGLASYHQADALFSYSLHKYQSPIKG